MSDPSMIQKIKAAVTIPVMAKVCGHGQAPRGRQVLVCRLSAAAHGLRARAACSPVHASTAVAACPLTLTRCPVLQARIGHFVEAQVLEAIGVDFIDESEVLTPADELHHINKHNFKVPVLCGCRNLGEALRRIAEVRQGCPCVPLAAPITSTCRPAADARLLVPRARP